MKRWLVVFLLAVAVPIQADIIYDEEPDEDLAPRMGPIHAGQLEINPILSMRINGSEIFYRAGVSVSYALNRYHQIGGSFVAGNRELDRRARRNFPDVLAENQPRNIRGATLTLDEGIGSSVSGFYRLNLPIQIQKRTYPFAEVFAARDFLVWGDVSEAGGSVGVRKIVSRRTAFTTQYGYTVLFYNGQRLGRHIITAGVSMFFR
ncbi:MAG: hypothetical protein O7G87_23780 [bacterium]|nr:hypothetical protein [bacterium]